MVLRKISLLVIAVVALGGYIYWIEIPKGEEKVAAEKFFPRDSLETFKEIRIITPEGEFGLVNTAPKSSKVQDVAESFSENRYAKWEIQGIPGSSVDGMAVEKVVSALTSAKTENRIPKEEIESDLGLYGVTPPALTLKVKGSDGDKTIVLGKKNEFLSKRYAQIQGDPALYLVEEALYEAASKKREDFRNKQPFAFSDYDLAEVKVTNPGRVVVARQKEPGVWRVGESSEYSGSSTAVTEYLRKVRGLKAVSFIDPPPSGEVRDEVPYGFTTPLASIALSFKEGAQKKAREFMVGKSPSGEEYFAKEKDSAIVYKIENQNIQYLSNVTVASMREREFIKVALDQVTEVTVEKKGAPTLAIKKSGESWTVDNKSGDMPFTEEYIRGLTQLKAIGFPAQSVDFGFADPTIKITFKEAKKGEGAEKTSTLIIGNEAPETGIQDEEGKGATVPLHYAVYSATPGDLSEPFIIDEESFKKISPTTESLISVTSSPVPSPTTTQP